MSYTISSVLPRHLSNDDSTSNSILCANRDEFLDRPTKNAEFHSFGAVADHDQPHQVLSGRDELAGGTWLGINRTGKVALL